VNNKAERYTRLQLYLTRRIERANEEHQRILQLCRLRDVPAATKLLRQHILEAGRSLKEALQERGASSKHP